MTIRVAFTVIPTFVLCSTYLEEDPDLKEVHLSFAIE